MRRTKAEAEQTRNAILEAALILFDEQGYVQTTLNAIAQKANVTRGAIYWHFANKEEIIAALAKIQFSELLQQNSNAISAPDTWKNLSDNFVAFFQSLNQKPDRLRFFRIFHQHCGVNALNKLHDEYKTLCVGNRRVVYTSCLK
ncbi:MAG: TetR family transcriptional regulator [Cardiobacteriaceae bacterium]|nr:TetR family transcriptional regulator [Cardiobacteriaceae bacterium]